MEERESRIGPPGEAEYDLLVDAVRDYALFLLGPTGEIRSWNSGAERVFGYEADEAIGQHFSLFYSSEDRRARKPDRELEVAGRDGRIEDEGWRIRKGGERFWANTIISTLYEDDGSVHGFAKVTRDLTERRTAEERLRRSEEMFRLLVSAVQDYAIFMLDPDGNIVTWNEGARRIKGYEGAEIYGRHFSIFYPPEDVEAELPWRLLETAVREGRVEQEGWRVRKDGSRFWADVVITAILDEESGSLRGFTKVTRDITDRMRVEQLGRDLVEQRDARVRAEERQRLAEASSEAAQEANRAKDEFLMILSHELRTPLSSILGWSRLLSSLEPDDPSVREGLDAIYRSSKLQAALIDDILDVSRIITGKLKLDREPVDAAEAIGEAADQIRDRAAAKSVRFEENVPQDLGVVNADRIRLEQVVWNLLDNAVKFTPEGGEVVLEASRRQETLEIVVSDSGAGIPKEYLTRIFDTFRQVDMGISRGYGGLGLGLTIVRHLVEAHGGTIHAQSGGTGQGSTFTVRLPLSGEKRSARETTTRTVDPRRLTGRLEDALILVVDDDPENRRFMKSVLEKAGARVESAESVPAALTACARGLPDLILTDISMPELDGRDLLGWIREAQTRHVPVVGVSAFDERVVNEVGQFDDFLRKPLDPFDLVARLERLVRE